MSEVLNFIQAQGWKYKPSGTDEYELGCPFTECPNHGEFQFYINKHTAKWNCKRCQKAGFNLMQLQFKLGLIKTAEPVKTTHLYVSPKDVEKWHTDLLANKEAMTYLINKRCIDEPAIRQFKLGWKVDQENPVIVHPTFEKGSCVGYEKNYYLLPNGMPKYKTERGSKLKAFNLENTDPHSPLIITEGKYDAESLWLYGYENVVSAPNGASSMGEWIEELKQLGFPKYILAVDNDKAGQEFAVAIGKILGFAKCSRVYPAMKDFNDCRRCGFTKDEIQKLFDAEEPMFTAPVTDISDYLPAALRLLEDPIAFKGVSTGWADFDKQIDGIRPGELTVSSGMPGDGKTTFAIALIGNLIKQDFPALIISPEMRQESLMIDLANNYFGRQVTKQEELEEFTTFAKGKVEIAKVFDLWTDKGRTSLLDHVFDVIEYSVKYRGVKFVLLDHMRLFLNSKQPDLERFAIDEFIRQCVHCCIQTKVHIWLIVQPKGLPSKQTRVTMSDLKGSSNIAQDAHNIVLIHRMNNAKGTESLVQIEVAKNREFGKKDPPILTLEFDMQSKANYFEIEET